MNKLTIIGVGMGDESLLTALARNKIIGSQRLLAVGQLSRRLMVKAESHTLSDIMAILEKERDQDTTVLVSGDAGFFSVSKSIYDKLCNYYEIDTINGLNSLQYFCGKLNKSYDDMEILSMHGKPGNIEATVSYNRKTFVLTGGGNKAHDICRQLETAGFGDGAVTVFIGENLSYPQERILQGTPGMFTKMEFSDLTVMLIENTAPALKNMPLVDADFIRGNVPMTKEEVRQIVLSKLKIDHNDILWDIGAGTGSVAVEMANRAWAGKVFAVEQNGEACGLISQNRKKHGTFNVAVIEGEATAICGDLPAPDKVFIGGSLGTLKEIVAIALSKTPCVRIVITAVTLQTIQEATAGFSGVDILDVTCVNISKSKKIGRYDMMVAQNPVYIITLQGKPE